MTGIARRAFFSGVLFVLASCATGKVGEIHRGQEMSDIRFAFGAPDSIQKDGELERWHYEALDARKCEIVFFQGRVSGVPRCLGNEGYQNLAVNQRNNQDYRPRIVALPGRSVASTSDPWTGPTVASPPTSPNVGAIVMGTLLGGAIGGAIAGAAATPVIPSAPAAPPAPAPTYKAPASGFDSQSSFGSNSGLSQSSWEKANPIHNNPNSAWGKH